MAASKQRALRSFAFLVACVLVHEAACTPTPASSVAMYGVSVDALQKQAVRLVLDNEYVAATTNAVSWATTAIGAFMAVAVGQAALQFSRNTAEFGTALTTFVTGALTTWWVWAVIVLALMCVGAHVHDTLQRDTAYSNQVHEEAQERQDEETRMTDGWTNEAALAVEKPGRFGNVFHIVDLLQAKNNELEALKAKRERLQKMMAYDNENRMHRDVYTRYLCWQRCSTNVLDCCKNPVKGSTCHVSKASMDLAELHLSGGVGKLNTKYQVLRNALNNVINELKRSASEEDQEEITNRTSNMTNGTEPLNITLPDADTADVATDWVLYYTLPVLFVLVVVGSCVLAHRAQKRAQRAHAIGWSHPAVQRLPHYKRKAYAWCTWCCPIVVFVALSGLQYWNNVFDAPHCMLTAVITAFVYSKTRDRGAAPMHRKDLSYFWNTHIAPRTPTADTVTVSAPVVSSHITFVRRIDLSAAHTNVQRNAVAAYNSKRDADAFKYRRTWPTMECEGELCRDKVKRCKRANAYKKLLCACMRNSPSPDTVEWKWDENETAWMLNLMQ